MARRAMSKGLRILQRVRDLSLASWRGLVIPTRRVHKTLRGAFQPPYPYLLNLGLLTKAPLFTL